LPGSSWVAFELRGKDRQKAGRQRAFSKDATQKVGNAKGEHEGVHDPAFAQTRPWQRANLATVERLWVTRLGTLASRVLGLVRDMTTAALLGLGEGGVMDAFVLAFRVPNLFASHL